MPYEIRFCRNTPEGADTDLGLCDPEERVLYIKYKQGNKETFKTFVHELLHAIEAEYDIEIGHKIINRLEEAMASLVEENSDAFVLFLFAAFNAKV